jgi:hypothetical protein
MRLGKMLSVGEVLEQPPVEEPAAAPAELTGSETAAAVGDDGHAQLPDVTPARR